MTAVAAARGKKSKLAIGSASPTTYRLAFTSFDHGCSTELLNTNEEASVGTLTMPKERVVSNRVRVLPRATLSPSLADWRQLLTWALFGAEAGAGPYTYAPADTPVEKYVSFQNDAAVNFAMTGVGVDRLAVRGRAGAAVEAELELVGQTYATGGSFPNIAPNVAPPLIFKSTGVTVGGTPVFCRDVAIEVSNRIDRDRFFNQATLAGLVNMGREVTVSLTLPVGQHAALWAAATGDAGVDVTVAFNAPGGSSLLFDFPAVKSQPESWQTPGAGEAFFVFKGMALGNSGAGNDEVAATITLPT